MNGEPKGVGGKFDIEFQNDFSIFNKTPTNIETQYLPFGDGI